MRNMLKATTLERKFPLLALENGCIISKDADITVAFRVELPELFTVTSAEYEAIQLGMFMETLATIVILAPIFLPLITKVGKIGRASCRERV